MSYRPAKWKKGKRIMRGKWRYFWSRDEFHIILNSTDRITGRTREVTVKGDLPEFNGWKMVRPEREAENGDTCGHSTAGKM